MTTTGLSMRERFDSDDYAISSVSYECKHGKHYEVEVRHKGCGKVHVAFHDHDYRAHWRHMYEASERFILPTESAETAVSSPSVPAQIDGAGDAS